MDWPLWLLRTFVRTIGEYDWGGSWTGSEYGHVWPWGNNNDIAKLVWCMPIRSLWRPWNLLEKMQWLWRIGLLFVYNEESGDYPKNCSASGTDCMAPKLKRWYLSKNQMLFYRNPRNWRLDENLSELGTRSVPFLPLLLAGIKEIAQKLVPEEE